MKHKIMKYKITFSDKSSRFLNEIAKKSGKDIKETLRNALAFYDYLIDEYLQGHSIMIKKGENKFLEIIGKDIFPVKKEKRNGGY